MTLTDKKALVAGFLGRCNRYADDKLEEYQSRLAATSASDALTLQDKIGHWTAYRAFNEYTLAELATDQLDEWFEDSASE